jgi:hypothetical protein
VLAFVLLAATRIASRSCRGDWLGEGALSPLVALVQWVGR